MLDDDADGTAASSPRTPGARTPVATSAADAFTAREHAREVPVRWSFVDEDDVDDSTATVGNVNAEEEEEPTTTTTTVTVDEKPNRRGKRHGRESFSENGDVAKQLYEAARQTRDGLRRRFDSFGVAFDDTVRAFTELADALWATENRKMVFKVLFFCTFAALFYLAVLYVFAHVWVAEGVAREQRALEGYRFAGAVRGGVRVRVGDGAADFPECRGARVGVVSHGGGDCVAERERGASRSRALGNRVE